MKKEEEVVRAIKLFFFLVSFSQSSLKGVNQYLSMEHNRHREPREGQSLSRKKEDDKDD